jgi:hypothetical protein
MIGRGEDVAVSNLVRCFSFFLLLVWLPSATAIRVTEAADFRPMADLPPLLEFARWTAGRNG